jgi:hypothetical protein
MVVIESGGVEREQIVQRALVARRFGQDWVIDMNNSYVMARDHFP